MNAYDYIINLVDKATKPLGKIGNEADETERKTQRLGDSFTIAGNKASGMGRMVRRAARSLAVLFSVGALTSFNNKLIDTVSTFEKYEAVLTNTFQSQDLGKASLRMIEDFASNTPYQVDALTGSFVQLVNRGFAPTKKEMGNLGDLAASQGKQFNQLTEALLDAQTGEFERLKEFGVKAKAVGDNVMFTFKGQTTTVKKTEGAIKDYVLSLGELDGVKGTMNVISGTIGGMLSNLGDRATMLRKQWGTQMLGLYESVITHLGGAIDWLKNNVDLSGFANRAKAFIDGVVLGFGDFKRAVSNLSFELQPLWNSLGNVFTSMFGVNNAASAGSGFISTLAGAINAIAKPLGIFATGLGMVLEFIGPLIPYVVGFRVAMFALNAVMAANPVLLLVMALGALVGIIHHAWQKVDWFRGGLMGLGESAKHLGGMLKDYVINRFKELLDGVVGLGSAFMKFFKGDFKGAFDEGKKAITNLVGVDSKRKLFEDGKEIGKKFNEGFKVGSDQVNANLYEATRNKRKSGKRTQIGANTPGYDELIKDFNGGGTGDGSNGSVASNTKGIEGITGGGKKQTNITLNLGKFMDNLIVNAESVEEGIEEIETKIQEGLLRAFNSVNNLQGV